VEYGDVVDCGESEVLKDQNPARLCAIIAIPPKNIAANVIRKSRKN
jgi:hypothetical protein